MGASLALGGCELPKDGVADPGFTPDAQQAAQFLPNATIILDREDLLAVAAAGVQVTPQVIADIQDQFRPDPSRALLGKIQIAYLGPIDFNFSRSEGARTGSVDASSLSAYGDVQRALPGHRVMWANLETGNLFVINYPQTDWTDKEIPALEDEDPAPTPDQGNPAGADVDIDWLRSRRYRFDAQGVLTGQESRFRVFEENEVVNDSFFKRLLSLGGATGAMIGRRHFMTAAHVLVEHDERTGRIKIFDVTIRPGQNGNTQLGDSARATQIWWMADWAPRSWGTARRANDMAWGVLDRPVGDETGYFGLMSTSAQNLRAQGLTLRNAGYSSCTPSNAPVPPDCLRRHIFLDAQECNILREEIPDYFGWGQAVAHGCDANRGHGGSPLVINNNGSLYIWAIHSGATNRYNYASRFTRSRHRNLLRGMFSRFPRND